MIILQIFLAEIVLILLYFFVFRNWFITWGATKEERTMKMPEDDITRNPLINMTHAIAIDAAPEDVFKWIKQIGQGRGGYFSYDWLERFFGFGIHNVYHIDPDLQDVNVGDWIRLHKNGIGMWVHTIEENEGDKKLVVGLDSRENYGELPEDGKIWLPVPKSFFIVGWWSFTCIEQPDGSTRLIERWGIEWTARNPVFNMILTLLAELPSFIMEQRMLRVVKMLSEGRSPDKLGIF